MPKTISSSEARQQFGALLRWVEENQDAVFITRRGQPVAVLISHAEYQELQRPQPTPLARRLRALGLPR